jgi:hypothetical protein
MDVKTTGARGYRNNNPCNIRLSNQAFVGEVLGDLRTDKTFKQFGTMQAGYRAVFVILLTYISHYGLRTVREWVTRWAPPSDGNHTENYIATVCERAEVSPDEAIVINDSDRMMRIVAAMAFVENGVPANMLDVAAGYELFRGKKA